LPLIEDNKIVFYLPIFLRIAHPCTWIFVKNCMDILIHTTGLHNFTWFLKSFWYILFRYHFFFLKIVLCRWMFERFYWFDNSILTKKILFRTCGQVPKRGNVLNNCVRLSFSTFEYLFQIPSCIFFHTTPWRFSVRSTFQ
jgi:hypothetical protein